MDFLLNSWYGILIINFKHNSNNAWVCGRYNELVRGVDDLQT